MKKRLVVLEGLDGSGKATQAARLTETLRERNLLVRKISFPDYQSPSSTLVRMYLSGALGTLDEVNVYAASSFYSMDRYASYQTIWRRDYQNGLIVADRYTTSNLCHQMSKLPREKWEDYIAWLTGYEYGLLELPAPDLVIYLDMPPATSRRLLTERYDHDESRMDLHEKNQSYLLQCRESALFAAQQLNWQMVRCDDGQGNPLAVEKISREILRLFDERFGPHSTARQ